MQGFPHGVRGRHDFRSKIARFVADTLAPCMAFAGLSASDATKYNKVERRVNAKAVVTMGAPRTRVRSVEASMALPFVLMTLESKSTSRPLMHNELLACTFTLAPSLAFAACLPATRPNTTHTGSELPPRLSLPWMPPESWPAG